jgi:cytochrome P450
MADLPVPAFDHYDRGFMVDPYPGYAQLRERCPVHHSDRHGGFTVLSRYAEVHDAALEWEVFSSRGDALAIPPNEARPLPITSDPPEHRRYRSVMAAYFSPRRVERMEPEIRALVRGLLDAVIDLGECDLSVAVSSALPTRMLAAMLGVPESDTSHFHHWVDTIVFGVATDPAAAAAAAAELDRYVVALLTTDEPRPDTFAEVLRSAEIDGGPLSLDEQVRMVVQLIFGALHTTTYLINGALLLLDEHRDARARLIADPALLEPAVEEFLRLVAPVQGTARKVTAPIDRYGAHFAEGDRVMLLWASACRDASVFTDPDELVIDRTPNRHVAFGIGVHRCVGAPLGRLQTRVALDEVLRRMPDYRVVHEGVVWGAASTRGILRLPVTWTPPGS